MDTGARGIKQAATLSIIALGYIAIGNLKIHGWLPVGHGADDEAIQSYRNALQVALEVLCIQEKAFGEESLPVGEALDYLVSIRLKRVLAIQEKGFER
ncbi:hypothetical protein LOK49_LG07G00174 [Camellia lanceoleosa]|uniref:Uncharacterized protein n=1 Tax=Camellia lanceoleosa TaxID=1840588 RepID=A0ACC0GXF5_9ERIC|nr:hypothetical protein LOK49_LG07G00174 [Camellia lanceoleosa]